MPTWSAIGQEIRNTLKDGKPSCDAVRRKYLADLHLHTRRNVILYATKWTPPDPNVPGILTSINDEDMQGIMEVVCGMKGDKLDLIMHSPGGSPTAAESIVTYLRSKFTDIRIIVPHLAMSAATMIACAGDSILMGKHSFLGPIDPQIQLSTALGSRLVPAQAVLDQFDRGVQQCQDPARLAAWLPMLSQYGPDLLAVCENSVVMARDLVRGWLKRYMFAEDPQATRKARRIADWLSQHNHFKSHGRHIPRNELVSRGLHIEQLEDNQDLQDLVLSVFHATTHTFNTAAVKIIESHRGRAFIKMVRPIQVVQAPQPPGSGLPQAPVGTIPKMPKS